MLSSDLDFIVAAYLTIAIFAMSSARGRRIAKRSGAQPIARTGRRAHGVIAKPVSRRFDAGCAA